MAESKTVAAPRRRIAGDGILPRARRWLRVLGPGLITGASDDDPSGISTYSVAGATTGYSMLWLALVTTPMMSVVQGMSARIGMVTGAGLMVAIRKACPLWLAYTLAFIVVVANTFNVGADIAGMAASARLVWHLPMLFWVVFFGIVLLVAQVAFPYRVIANVLKWLTLSLFAYVITAFVVHPRWTEVLAHLVRPEVHFSASWLTTAVGVLGTTITPYLFFWQSNLEVEEEKAAGRKTLAQRRGATAKEIAESRLDVNVGMIFSNLVMFFIIVTCAATLFANHKEIQTAQDAAEALRPLAGDFAYLLFTLGMVGTGLLGVPALACSSAFIVGQLFAFRRMGLDEPPTGAPRFYGVIVAGVVIGIVMNFIHVDPIKALFWSAVLNGVAAVPLLVVMTVIANKRSVMGKWTNTPLANAWAGLTIVLMTAAAAGMFVFWGRQ
jgi:NRAMP (natural resistance-associated macrophage protein)-like metal ion transporter